MMWDVLLASGMLLSTASQLRPAGGPVGPGEICLVVWVLAMLAKELNRLGPPLTPPLLKFLVFWLAFGISLSVGTLAGYAIGDAHDSALFLHDALAYPLLAGVSCLSVVDPGARCRLHRVAWLVAGLGTASLTLQLSTTWGLDIGGIDPWYWDRFRGWSANPNQLALLCAVLGLVALHLADVAVHTGARIAAIACGALAIYVGRLTKSDTFSIVLVAAGPIFLALKMRIWLQSSARNVPFGSALATVLILAVPLTLIAAVPLQALIVDQASDLAKGLAKDNGKSAEQEAELRFYSWREAIDRGLESGMLGLGPGPHLEIPPELVAARRTEALPKFIETPQLNGTPNFEAHNTFLDLFTQGGLLAVLSFVGIAALAFINTYRTRLAGLTTLLCGVAIFALPNLIVRHPIFWFAIALCLVQGVAPRRESTIRASG
jgi:O-antigen ligase